MRIDAVIRNLEVIGEAVKHLPDAEKQREPGIPWRKIAGLRDVLAHQYFGIDLEIVWDAVSGHLTPLRDAVRRLLA